MRRHGILGLIGALALAIGLGFLWMERTGRAAMPASAEPTVNPLPELAREPDPVERSSDARRMEAAIPAMEAQPAAEGADASSAASFRIRVVEKHTTEPIAGARVTLFEVEPSLVKVTDEQGSCQLPEPATRSRRLLVEKEGFFHASAYYQRLPELTISLSRVTTLHGRVLAADTSVPVPDARIRFVHQDCKGCDPVEVTSGPDGGFELAGVPRRAQTLLVVQADGFAQNVFDFELRSDAERVEQDFHLERGLEVSGRVVDFESGAGIPGARVGEMVADGSGSFRGRILPPEGLDRVGFMAEADGYCTLIANLDPARLDEPLEFRLPRGAIVQGTVRDAEGRPIPNAHVDIDEDHRRRALNVDPTTLQPTPLDELPEDWFYQPRGFDSSGKTDAEGRFRITNVLPWSRILQVDCFAEGYTRGTLALDRVGGPGETTWAELVLERALPEGSVHGMVLLNGTHLPLWRAEGRLHWSGPERSGVDRFRSATFHADVEPGDVAFRVEFDGLPAGLEGSAFELHVEPGANLEHTIQLRMPTRAISGRVTYEDGTPAAKAEIQASCLLGVDGRNHSTRAKFSTEAGADGRYAIEVPEWERDYRVEAEIHHCQSSIEGIRAGASDVDHVLPVPGRLLFRVVDGRTRAALDVGSQIAFGWKRSSEAGFHDWYVASTVPDAEGWFEDWLPSGRLDLEAREQFREAYAPALLEGVLLPSAGDSPRFEFILLRLSTFLLQLADGCPIVPEDHSVALIREDVWAEVRFDGDARTWIGADFPSSERGGLVYLWQLEATQINGLSPGRYRFKIHPPDLVIEPAEVYVEESSEPVIVRWRWSR